MGWKAISRSLAALIIAALVVLGAIAFIAYRQVQAPTETVTAPGKVRVAVLFDVGGRGDLSFNDMAALGAEKAKRDLGVEVEYNTPKSLAHMVPLLEELSRGGKYDLLILVGFLWVDALNKTADKFPKQKYALIDASTGVRRDNVAEFVFKEQEGAAVVGVLAAGMAREVQRELGESGPIKVGAVAGMSIPPLWRFHIGYLFGVKYFEKKTGERVEFYWTYTGKFDDPALGYSAAWTFLGQGVKVLYGLAGLTHVGMFNAVIDWNERGGGRALAIGQDASQEWFNPKYIPLSGSKRVDVAAYKAIEMVVKGAWRGGLVVLGYAEGGVGVWDLEGVKYFAQIAYETGQLKGLTPDDIVRIVKDARGKYVKSDVEAIAKELEGLIVTGKIVFKEPASEEEYLSIIRELEKGNLNAALAKGSIG
ncbi:MAG: BMP family protein [Thermoprotei archaeon]|nr:BMP family protein [Thermoprotei archaeon]